MMSDCKIKHVILVVSNIIADRFHLRKILVPRYDLETAADGAEGLTLTKRLLPDLVICDIALPVMPGTTVCKTLKKDIDTGHIPLILVSCTKSEEFIIKGFASGADDCISRPFNANILKARIKSLIDNRRKILDKLRFRALPQPEEPDIISEDSKFLEQLNVIVEEHLPDPLFTVEELGDILCMSRASMYRKVHSLTGQSPQLYIRTYRLKRAARLLESNNCNVTETCFNVGFTSTAYFAKCFKEKFHQSPRDFAGKFSNGSTVGGPGT